MRMVILGLDPRARQRLPALRHQLRYAAARGARARAGARHREGAQRHRRPEGGARPPGAPRAHRAARARRSVSAPLPSSSSPRRPQEAMTRALASSRATAHAPSTKVRHDERRDARRGDDERRRRQARLARSRANGPLRTLIATLARGVSPSWRSAPSSCGSRCRARRRSRPRSARPCAAATRAPTSSTATAGCSPPTSKPTRCSPIPRACSIATRWSKSSPSVFPDLDGNALRKDLSDRSRRFVWMRRGLAPRKAQAGARSRPSRPRLPP